MKKAIGIGVMAALVAGLGLTAVPATVYADDGVGQAGSGTLIGQGKDGIYSVKADGKELIKGDAVSESNPIYYFSNTEPKQVLAMKSFGGGSGQVPLPLPNIAPNETSCGSMVVKGKTYKTGRRLPVLRHLGESGRFLQGHENLIQRERSGNQPIRFRRNLFIREELNDIPIVRDCDNPHGYS